MLCASLLSCAKKPDADTLVVLIESSPANLDPRIGKDAQSERIGELLFDSLVRKDEHFNLLPGVAESWEIPDAPKNRRWMKSFKQRWKTKLEQLELWMVSYLVTIE